MKTTTWIFCAAAFFGGNLTIASSASAFDLGSLGAIITGTSTTPAQPANTVDSFLTNVKESETLMKNMVDLLGKVFVSHDKWTELENATKTAETMSDAKAKEAKLKQIERDKQTVVLNAVRSEEAKKIVTTLDAQKKTDLSSAIFNLLLLTYKDNQLLQQGQKIVTNAPSDPTIAFNLANKMTPVKEAISSLGYQVKYLQPLSTALIKLAKIANIPVIQPTSALDPLKRIGL